MTNKASFGDKLPSPGEKPSHQRKPSEDFIMGTTSNLSAIQSSIAKMGIKAPPHPNINGEANEQGIITVEASKSAPNQAISSTTTNGDMTSTDSAVTGVSSEDSVHKLPSTEHVERPSSSAENVNTGSPMVDRSRSGSNSSVLSQGSLPSSQRSLSTSPQLKRPGMSNLPPSLAGLQDPNTFSLDPAQIQAGKNKITKASFDNKSSSITDNVNDPTDPLSMLDPLWTIKTGEEQKS